MAWTWVAETVEERLGRKKHRKSVREEMKGDVGSKDKENEKLTKVVKGKDGGNGKRLWKLTVEQATDM